MDFMHDELAAGFCAQQQESAVLPAPAREILRRAISIKYPNDFERRKAIDAAIAKVKRHYPQHFQQET